MKWIAGALGALSLAFVGAAVHAQGANVNNTVGVWGQDTGTGLPCIVAPHTGSATCVLPTSGSGGGGGGAVYGPTVVGSSVANPPVILGFQDGSGKVAIITPSIGLPITQSGTWNINNISGTVSLPTGASTAANQSTGNGYLSTTATNTGTIATQIGATTSPAAGTVNAQLAAVIAAIQAAACTSPCQVTNSPTANSGSGITPVVSASAESNHVLKSGAGNLYSLYVTTGATAGYLMTFNATSAPSDGAVTPVDCVQVAANATGSISVGGAPPDAYSTGITAVFSSTGCFTKTASATAFFKGRVQ